MVHGTGAHHVSGCGRGGAGRLRLLLIGLRLSVVGLRKIVIMMVATRHGPSVIAALDIFVPNGSVAAREFVLQIGPLSVRNTSVKVLAVLRVTLETIFLADACCVLQVLGRWLSRGLRL